MSDKLNFAVFVAQLFGAGTINHPMRWPIFFISATAIFICWLVFSGRLPAWLVGTNEVPVTVVRAHKRMLAVTIRSDGLLKPAKEVEIFSRLAGKVVEQRFKIGDSVGAGAVIAVIYSNAIAHRLTELQEVVGAAQKGLKEREGELAAAEALAAQRHQLFKQDLIARREFEQAESAVQTASARVELARAQLSQQESMLAQTRKVGSLAQVTAPVNGRVSQHLVEIGASIGELTPIMALAVGRHLKFFGTLKSPQVNLLRRGLKATLSSVSAPEKSFDGTVASITLGPENGQARVDIEIPPDKLAPGLAAGMAAQAIIYLDKSEPAILLPQTALIEDAGRNFVFKFAAARAAKQEITRGAMVDNEFIVRRGVNENDLVIVDHLKALQNGSRVRLGHKATVAD